MAEKELQALAEIMDLDHYIFRKVKFGDEEIDGARVFRIELPRKGFPAWKIVVREDWSDDSPPIAYFVTGPIIIEATEVEVVEATPEEED